MTDVDLEEATGEPIVRDSARTGSVLEPEPDDGKEPCPECGQYFHPGPGMGVHRKARHGVQSENAKRLKRRACEECGKLYSVKDLARHKRDVHGKRGPGRPPNGTTKKPASLSASEITQTAALMLWPKGMPTEHVQALLDWHTATMAFLTEVQGSA